MSTRRFAAALVTLACAVPAGASPAAGLDLAGTALHGYLLDVAGATEAGPLGPGGLADLARLRLGATPRRGAWSLDVAYEQVLDAAQHPNPAAVAVGGGSAAGDWLPLDGTLARGANARWHQRLDRLSLAWAPGPLELTLGRQPISWATTLLLTPDDPFAPFSPEDPFREYRIGVDAARARWYPGPFTEWDLVARLAGYADDTTFTLLARARTTRGGWDLSAWGGRLDDRAAGAIAATRAVGGWGVRASFGLRRTAEGADVVRAAAGADRRVTFLGRDLYLVAEAQHDGLGARDARDLARVAASTAARHGELQLLGRDALAAEASWTVHPLVTLDALALWDPRDGSALAGPAVAWSASDEATVRAGAFVPVGPGTIAADGAPASEFGAIPLSGYVSLSVFFF